MFQYYVDDGFSGANFDRPGFKRMIADAESGLISTVIVKTELGYGKFDFHSLRHTHATELCEAGVNIKEIQRRLGHSTMEVTSKRYLHATELMEEQSVELMNEMHGCSDNQPRDDRWNGFRIVR